jgi:hypothetical protein
MTKGIRFIDGREYLLCGREFTKEKAKQEKAALLASWERVRIVKLSDWDFMLYVHGSKRAS